MFSPVFEGECCGRHGRALCEFDCRRRFSAVLRVMLTIWHPSDYFLINLFTRKSVWLSERGLWCRKPRKSENIDQKCHFGPQSPILNSNSRDSETMCGPINFKFLFYVQLVCLEIIFKNYQNRCTELGKNLCTKS